MKLGDSGLIARREGVVEKERCHCWRAVQRLHIELGASLGIAMGGDGAGCHESPVVDILEHEKIYG